MTTSLLGINSQRLLMLQRGALQHQSRWSTSMTRMTNFGGLQPSRGRKVSSRTINASKNSKVQAVAFDFDLLKSSIRPDDVASNHSRNMATSSLSASRGPIGPNKERVQHVAGVLNVNPGDKKPRGSVTRFQKDDLDLLQPDEPANKKSASEKVVIGNDIRTKYATKLRTKTKGGVTGLKKASQRREESMKHGDSKLYAAARKIVADHDMAKRKWMSMTGTGKLLSYLTNRATKIALLPPLMDKKKHTKLPCARETEQHMDDLVQQLQDDVCFDVAIPLGRNANEVLHKTTRQLKLREEREKILLVSDKDEYLQAARDAGMMTCRVKPPNARRGNVSTCYTTKDVQGVEEVINRINGISFNAVLNN